MGIGVNRLQYLGLAWIEGWLIEALTSEKRVLWFRRWWSSRSVMAKDRSGPDAVGQFKKKFLLGSKWIRTWLHFVLINLFHRIRILSFGPADGSAGRDINIRYCLFARGFRPSRDQNTRIRNSLSLDGLRSVLPCSWPEKSLPSPSPVPRSLPSSAEPALLHEESFSPDSPFHDMAAWPSQRQPRAGARPLGREGESRPPRRAPEHYSRTPKAP